MHAYDFAVAAFSDDSGPRILVMYIGPARSGTTLIEVGAVERADYDAICLVHAMVARNETLRKGGLAQ
ncbi:MAG: hypothetical protein LBI33_00475 [Propionibacteriaceae bacterium]|jgi:hypothetical protein|nr:hypothetical protein [Propionibacteriaceae bacterium]